MSDRLTREFRAQLTTTVESALRRILFEIMNIFENSLHDHRMELAQRGEEVAQLKIKLQSSEIRLKDSKCGHDGEEDKNTDQEEREPEPFLPVSEQTFEVPEIDFEVPADWCAPLGCETVIKQEEVVCPSVRLRQLYIPLQPVHLTQREVDNQITPEKKRGRRDFSSEGQRPTRHRWEIHKQEEAQHSPVRNITADHRKHPSGLRGKAKGFKGRNKECPEKEQESPMRKRRGKSNCTANEADSMEGQCDAEGMYACGFCHKEFGTSFGHRVHLRTHLKCSGCKKKFQSLSVLKSHGLICKKLNSKKNKGASTKPSQSQPDEEKRTAAIEEWEDASLDKQNKPSKKHGSTRIHRCSYCKKQFHTLSKLNGHLRLHTGETPFPCRICPKKFHAAQALKVHVQRIHKGRLDSTEKSGGVSWTAPLDGTEDDPPPLPLPSDQLQSIKTESTSLPSSNPPSPETPEEKEKQHNQHSRLLLKWHTMGTRCDEGYICLVCQKISRNKYMLMEHFRIHTGEKPLRCNVCPAKFRCRSQLSLHRRKCGIMIQCDKCEKNFSTKVKYNRHMQREHRNWTHFCKICGKGFLMNGWLLNHMRLHDQKDSVFESSVC
ncbi:zinc finger protein 62 homolog [Takifugu flavidus]|uniref:zinc finger protein 62 homolog n=1 Tax=Takifugu flavidus TaxID=433684 RepID=UPI002544B93D|nr:zinc finger protein 62 homolog [Takifugu flavidus]